MQNYEFLSDYTRKRRESFPILEIINKEERLLLKESLFRIKVPYDFSDYIMSPRMSPNWRPPVLSPAGAAAAGCGAAGCAAGAAG